MLMGTRARLLGAAAVLTLAIAAPAAHADVLATWGDSSTLSHEVRGVAVAADGDVYVADPVTSRITVFTRDGVQLRSWGGFGDDEAEFVGLYGIAIGPDGDVYATDAASVQRFSPTGPSRRASAASAGAPAGCAEQPGWRSRRTARSTSRTAATGGCRRSAPTEHSSAWSLPTAVATAPWISTTRAASRSAPTARSSSPRTSRSSSRGSLRAARSPRGTRPESSASRSRPTARSSRSTSTRTSSAARPSTARRSAASAPASAPQAQPGERLNRPAAVATDCRGAVYVADRGEQRIHVFGDTGLAAPPCVIPPPPPIPPAPPAAAAAPGPEPQIQVAGISEASPEPTLGASGVGEPVSGTVLVQKPGEREFSRLKRRSKLPVGTTVDVTNGVVRITFATAPEDIPTYGPTQTGEFWGGQFRFFQAATGSLVDVILTGDQPACDSGAQTSAKTKSKQKSSSRFVWGKAKGRFRTTGNNGAATVRGTYWYTEDRCDGTLFRTREGRVDVKDFGRSATVQVKAGQKYLARVPCASRRAFDIRLLVPARTGRDGQHRPRERQARARAPRRATDGARGPARAAEAADPGADPAAARDGRYAARRP